MLDQAQLSALKPADRDRYMALEQLFAQPGWKLVVALAKQNATAQVQRAAFAASWADNRIAVGNGAAWNTIATLEEATMADYERMVAETERERETLRISDESDFE